MAKGHDLHDSYDDELMGDPVESDDHDFSAAQPVLEGSFDNEGPTAPTDESGESDPVTVDPEAAMEGARSRYPGA